MSRLLSAVINRTQCMPKGKVVNRASLPIGGIGFGTTWVLWLMSMKFSGPSSHLVVACSLLLRNYFVVAMVDSFLEIPRTSNSRKLHLLFASFKCQTEPSTWKDQPAL
ncbi:Hypothetical predicted protein [Podarcis lilfordi]|uniref:Uncharacterized protein n=1 Tax=Podarcis lilfordi TaxID=74358 RepID=A0AA35LGZ2_9SAUR|nr:Hypothetical predicted protein [Podarcis lilfordi]